MTFRCHDSLRVLFIENDDSFSWNVVDSLPVARSCIDVRSGREVARDLALLDATDVVVVGPGPTDPVRAGMVAIIEAAARARRPLLGICLGYQALGLGFGARLVRVRPAHGQQSTIQFFPSRLFPHFVGPQLVMRYHSLALSDIATPLRCIAQSEDGIPMAVEHATLPLAGLQFHPDSFGSPRGREMLAHFFEAVTCS
jgi:anthranilate synthase component II